MFKKYIYFIFSLLVVFFIAEVVFYFLIENDAKKKRELFKSQKIAYVSDLDYSKAYPDHYGDAYYYNPNTSVNALLKVKNGKEIYNVQYDIDANSRRKTLSRDREKHILFFGGSFTFGEGVSNYESLPSRFTYYSKKYQAYNFGVQGAAINNLLINFKKYKNLRYGVKEKKGVAVYLFQEFHFKRLISYINLIPRKDGHPNKQMYKNIVTNPLTIIFDEKKNFYKSLPYKEVYPASHFVKSVLSYSSILRYFKVSLPLYWNTSHFQYLENIMLSLHIETSKYFGTETTYLVLARYFSTDLRDRIKKFFKNSPIKIIDINEIGFSSEDHEKYDWRKLYIEGDGHPSALYYELVAKVLAREIDKRSID